MHLKENVIKYLYEITPGWSLKGGGVCMCVCTTRNAALALSALSMPRLLNFPCCKLLCIRLTALLTPRWMSCRVVAGKPCRSLLNSTSLPGQETTSVHASMSHESTGTDELSGQCTWAPEVGLQSDVSVVDHGTEAVDVGAGQSSADALLHNIETVVHHTGGQLAFFAGIHGNSLKHKIRLDVVFL